MKTTKRHHRTIRAAMGQIKALRTFNIPVTAGLFDFSWNGPNRLWIFPDGSTSTAERPTRTLDEAGTVKLIVGNQQDWQGNYLLKDNGTNARYVGYLSDLPPITYYLQLTYCGITGNIADLPRLTTFVEMSYCSGITGCLADAPATSYYFSFIGCSNVSGAAPAGLKATQISLTDCPNIDIDQTIINIDTAGSSNGTLTATGTTPAATAASATARANLIAKGWTLTINT